MHTVLWGTLLLMEQNQQPGLNSEQMRHMKTDLSVVK